MSIFDQPIDSVDLGWWLATQLGYLQSGPNTVDIDAAFGRETELNVVSASSVNSPTYPPVYWANSGTFTLILVGPCQDILQGAALIEGYTFGYLAARPSGFENQWAHNAMVQIVQWAGQQHLTSTRNVYIAGHSAGGMIAQDIYKYFLDLAGFANPYLVTFGAPRTSGPTIARAIGTGNVTRWMNDTDPVPLIPPRLVYGPAWAVQVASDILIGWGKYVHTAGGISLNETGQGTARDTPQGAALLPTLSLAAFLLGQLTGEGVAHKIGEYQRRLNVSIGETLPTQREMPRDRFIEPIADQAKKDITVQQRAAENRVFAQGEQQNQVPVKIPDTLKARVVKQGRIWSVYWGPAFIAMGPTKRKALGLKQDFNNFLRRMQRQAVTEPDAFIHQAQLYFDLATTDGNGFEPVMQDEFPED